MKLTRKERVFFFQACPTASLAYAFFLVFFAPAAQPSPLLYVLNSKRTLWRLLEVSIAGIAGLRRKVVAMALLHSGIRVCCTPPAIGRRRPQFDGTALPCCSRSSSICSFSGGNLSFFFASLSVASAIGSGEQVSASLIQVLQPADLLPDLRVLEI
jgi:hypothetical protein